MSKAVYAGTFDPITNGHLDIALRAGRLFDEIVIAVAEDNYKHTLFSTAERCDLVRRVTRCIPNASVDSFSGLLVDYCKEHNAGFIVRGLRVVLDFEKELQMALMNRNLYDKVDTVFLMGEAPYLFVSSSLVKNAAQLGGDISELVPPQVSEALLRKFTREGD
ncbi:MAG: pantetheine-phosphate adenylyltransferase [Clostridiales bacterium]|nr:pantetheine-phosphate adenylyltransferase [Clostridiales bacterium]